MCVLTQQHDVSLQVVQAAVSVTADAFLHKHNQITDNTDRVLKGQKISLDNLTSVVFVCVLKHLDLPEVNRFADELVVFWKLLP